MPKFSFALMSGGAGRRFGADKTKALLKGVPLYQYGLKLGLALSDDVIHVSRDSAKYRPFLNGIKYVEDAYPNQCPMAGMMTAADIAINDYIFVLSADSPLFEKHTVEYMASLIADYDAVIPSLEGKHYNLAALYSKRMIKNLKTFYEIGSYKLSKCYDNFNILFLDDELLNKGGCSKSSFLNINTTSDLVVAQKESK